MKKLLLLAALLLFPTAASAQCNGNFGVNTVCGSLAGGAPGAVAFSSFPASSISLDAICSTNNDSLIRLTGTWQCQGTGTAGHVFVFADGAINWSGNHTWTKAEPLVAAIDTGTAWAAWRALGGGAGNGTYFFQNGTSTFLFGGSLDAGIVNNEGTNGRTIIGSNGAGHIWDYPSGGVYVGASPADPGANTTETPNLALAGSSSGKTTLTPAATASGTLTVPSATDQLVARATTDTLTNKTLGSPTNVVLGSDAAGDIYYRNSGGNLTRLGIGTSGQVLNVGAGPLPAWTTATALSGAGFVADYVSSNYYLPFAINGSTTGSVPQDRIWCFFGTVGQQVTIKGLAVRNNNTSTRNAQMAVYSLSGDTLTLIDSTPNVSLVTTNVVYTGALGNTTDVLRPGILYGFCFNQAATNSMYILAGGSNLNGSSIGSATPVNVLGTQVTSSAGIVSGKSTAQAFGTGVGIWPGTLSLSGMADEPITTNTTPVSIAFQVN